MMERAEKAGLGVALVGHAALFALLSLRLLTPPLPVPPPQQAMEVSLAPDVALQQAAPPAPTPPAPSEASDQGVPEEAAAPAEPTPAPPPPKPQPQPKPVPQPKPAPKVEPKPAPPKPAPEKPKPEPKPAEKPKTAPVEKPKPAPVAKPKPAPAAEARPVAKPAPARPAPAKPAPARAATARPNPDRLASVVADAARATRAEGTSTTSNAARPRGSRLGSDFLKGLADTPAKAPPSAAAPGAVMNAKAAADIGSAILRQVQPCADRQVIPGPGAERIRVSINLKLNRDGSLAAPPRVVNHDGIDTDNRRYLDRVDDLAIATFTGCAPLRGLPANLYDVPNGWRSFTLRFNLRG